jgi:hypothetical protein
MSLIGMVILVGIVVNDAIVKVDFINQMRNQGLVLRQAILEAGKVRLRPIVMTTVTTVLGLTPMALGLGRGSDLRAPLAVAVIGGLISATALTLIVVPVAYDLIEEGRVKLRTMVGLGQPGAGSAAADATTRRPADPPGSGGGVGDGPPVRQSASPPGSGGGVGDGPPVRQPASPPGSGGGVGDSPPVRRPADPPGGGGEEGPP